MLRKAAVLLALTLVAAGTASGTDRLRTASATDRAAMMHADKTLSGHTPLRAWVWGSDRRYGALCYRVGGSPEPNAFTRVGRHRWRSGLGDAAPNAFINAYAKACRRVAQKG
jgi:hypothetical protein